MLWDTGNLALIKRHLKALTITYNETVVLSCATYCAMIYESATENLSVLRQQLSVTCVVSSL